MGLSITIIGVKSDDTVQIKNTVDEYFNTHKPEYSYKLITDLKENKDWSVLLFDLIIEDYEDLVEVLSVNLQTKVTGISDQDITNYSLIRTYDSGKPIDLFEILDGELLGNEGYFEDKFSDSEDISQEEIGDAINDYEETIGLYHYSDEILDNYD